MKHEEAQRSETTPRVVYVMGRARSGSTLLGDLLGQVDGLFHAGELRRLWLHLSGTPGHPEIPCSCGARVLECPFWSAVADSVRSDPDVPSTDTVLASQAALRGRRRFWTLAVRLRRDSATEPLVIYAAATRAAYRAVAQVAGAQVIVDTSKSPALALLLHASGGARVFLVHLVRDPRAVMHSWTRDVVWPGADHSMVRYRPWQTAVRWDVDNAFSEYVRRAYGADRSAVTRYEDLVSSPEATLRDLLTAAGERFSGPVSEAGQRVRFNTGHSLGGNPSKLRKEPVAVRADDEWRRAMSSRDKWLGTIVALPFLRRYGYPIRTPQG